MFILMKEFNETCEKLILAAQQANLLTSAGSRSHISPSARMQAGSPGLVLPRRQVLQLHSATEGQTCLPTLSEKQPSPTSSRHAAGVVKVTVT